MEFSIMPAPTVLNGRLHHFPIKYEGNGGGQRVGQFIPFTDNGTISKSCMFDDGSSSYLSRTHSASNKKTFTFSAWIKRCVLDGYQRIFNATDAGDNEHLIFRDTNVLHFYSGDATIDVKTNRTFENNGKWYHIVLRVDTTQATASNRVRLYVDGSEITDLATATYPAQDADTAFNGNVAHDIGRSNSSSQYFDGYMAEVNFMDGQSYGPDTFGVTDTSSGQWVPKSLGSITYGTNGFRLTFANGAGQTIGDDTSGNGNDFTVSGIGTDHITTDSPTQNHSVLSFRRSESDISLNEGGTKLIAPSGAGAGAYGSATGSLTFNPEDPDGFYWEVHPASSYVAIEAGIVSDEHGTVQADNAGQANGHYIQSRGGGGGNKLWVQKDDNSSTYADTGVSNGSQKIGLAVKGGKMWFALDNTWVLGGNPSTGANAQFSGITGLQRVFAKEYNTGTLTMKFNSDSWEYSPPTGFQALQQDNLDDVDEPVVDVSWIKSNEETRAWAIHDSTRGVEQYLGMTGAQALTQGTVEKFLKKGFQVGENATVNNKDKMYISYNFVANNATQGANTDGSGSTLACTYQTNQDAGFSIVKYTGSSNDAKVEHGLSQTPDFVMVKNYTGSGYWWYLWHKSLAGGDSAIYWNDDQAEDTSEPEAWGGSIPTNKVINLGGTGGTSGTNEANDHVA